MDMKFALFAVVLVLFFATGVITLLGIIQRVQIERKYLNALFSAFILELTAAVLVLFSATDFFSSEPEPSDDQELVQLVSEFFPQQTLADLKQTFTDMSEQPTLVQQNETQDSKLIELSEMLAQRDADLIAKDNQIKWLNDELELRKESTLRLSNLERQFLVRMSELNSRIAQWGTSINFRWQPEEKREIALMLQEAFKEIGFMRELEIPNDDPLLTHSILVRYQTEKKFAELGFLTPQVVAFIIHDYLGPLRVTN
jgi:hypothetical protein